MDMNEIMISIVCITYNHEDYIKDTLDGFLRQDVDFKYEIILHDDASTDKTVEIIRSYEKQYPDVIYGIYQKENQYSKKKNVQFLYPVYTKCKGKYIAVCEGDDFWIDRHKLQLQVDFLEKHSDYFMTTHNALRVNYSSGVMQPMDTFAYDKKLTEEDVIMLYNGMIPTASMVMRADILKMDKIFLECEVGDWPLQLYSLTKGNIYYFSRIMSVYRSFHEGAWSEVWRNDIHRRIKHSLNMIDFLRKYNQYTKCKYNDYISSRIQRYIYTLFEIDIDKRLLLEQFTQCDENSGYVKEIRRLYKQLYDENYEEESIRIFIKQHKHILVFGAGDYAARLTKQLNNNSIGFDGFIVSKRKENEREYLGRPVWTLGDVPFKFNEIGVIVAIKPVNWCQLVNFLERSGLTEYICPFLFNV